MVNITEMAADKIQEMLAEEEAANLFLRIGVREGGCSGFSYGMGFDDEMQDGDQQLDIQGMKVVVDGYSMKFLRGLEIDWKESAMGGGFTIFNPNATATCGCGSSFRTAAEAGNPAAEPC